MRCLTILHLNIIRKKNRNRMRRQTCGCVTCAKLSRQKTDPSFLDTFTRHFLKQNYPKDISDVVYKSLITKLSYQTFV